MMKNKILLMVGMAVFVALLPISVGAKSATSIDATPASTTVKAGESVTWTVTASYDDASTEDVSAFALFDIPSTAGGTLSANTYKTEVPGTYTIPVTVGAFTDSVSLTVVHGDAISLELSASSNKMVAGSSAVTFTSSLIDKIGNTWDATGQMTLTSDEKDATLTSTSFASTKTGTWTITANAGDLKATKQVTVMSDAPTKIIIEGDATRSIELDKDITLSSSLVDQYGNIATDEVTWTTSSDNITVDVNGKVTAKTIGTATVTATSGEFSATVEISVSEKTTSVTANTNSETNTNTATTDEVASEDNAGVLISPEEENTTETTNNEACKKLELWILAIVLLVYVLVLLAYYALIRREDDKSWWIFPALLTVIGIIIWNKYLCPDTVQWFPWLLVAFGLGMTGYGRGQMRKTGTHGSMPPPTDKPQNPLF